ncbi:hypothetical protein EYF80_042214 [Liparis tanakae]|uniref:Uncharacterized protein n=1 Tax=Liparis tanakae TaxID=230148 RepID=A0A4Z2G4S5_9TELE|nr:hypothetical protein EYF80_042214 [Liparis tanakae]
MLVNSWRAYPFRHNQQRSGEETHIPVEKQREQRKPSPLSLTFSASSRALKTKPPKDVGMTDYPYATACVNNAAPGVARVKLTAQ